MTACQRVILWNSAGFRASASSTLEKFNFFDSQFPNASFGIAALVETHHKDAHDYSQELGQYTQTHHILHSPVSNETHSGIIVIISKIYEIIGQTETIPGRLFNVRLKKAEKNVNLSVFYGPQWAKMKKDEIINTINKFHENHDPHDNNIILGDFNFAEFDEDKGKKMDQRDKLIKPYWDDFLSKNAVIDPFRVQCPKRKIFSFSAAQGKSRGDRVYVNEDSIAAVNKLRYINTPFLTAHKIMTFDWQEDKKIGPSPWKMNSSVIHDSLYVTEIEEIFQELEALQIPNPVEWWDLFIMVVQGTTMSYTKRKAKIKNSLKAFLTAKVEDFEKADNSSERGRPAYRYYKSRLNDLLRGEIRGHEIRTKGQPQYELNEPDISTYSKFEKRYQAQSVIYQLANDKGEIETENDALLGTAEKYYTKLFGKGKVNWGKQQKLLQNVGKRISTADKAALDASLTIEELEKSVMSLLSNKSPGPDGITAEFYKKFW